METDITRMSAREIVDHVRNKRISATEVLEASMGWMEKVNPFINAICTLNERAKDQAAEVDRRLKAGEQVRPLEGVPFVVKDIIPTEGIRTTFGSRICENYIPSADAITVERIKKAGGIVIGKSNTPEFAHDPITRNKIFGTTRNPWDLNFTAGGSSGGTASAIAAGIIPVGLGTDMGGSIRYPSSLCGIVGIRPAPGRVPVFPARMGKEGAPELGWDAFTYHVHGPMTRTVADCGLMLAVLSGPDDRDPSSIPSQGHDYARAALGERSLAGKRIAYSLNLKELIPVDPEVAGLVEKALKRFEELGCIVSEDCFDMSGLREIIAGTRAFGMVARYSDYMNTDSIRSLMTPVLVDQIREAQQVGLQAVGKAEHLRTLYWHRARSFMERYDYFITPTAGTAAYRLDQAVPSEVGGKRVERFYDTILTLYAITVTGLPAISVPCGFTSLGLPVGFQLVGRRLREDRILEAAAVYAAACPENFRMPSINLNELESFAPEVESAPVGFIR